jgi:hypothetical protein
VLLYGCAAPQTDQRDTGSSTVERVVSPPSVPAGGDGRPPPQRPAVSRGSIRLEHGQIIDLAALVVLIVIGVGLKVAEHRTGVVVLGTAANAAWLGSAVLAGWLVRNRLRLVRNRVQHLWRRLGGLVDDHGLWVLVLCALTAPGFLASAPGRIKTIGEIAGPTFAATLVGTFVGLLQLAPKHRDRAFRRLRHLGWLTPVLYSGCFFVCALAFFTQLTLLSGVRFEAVRDVTALAAWRVVPRSPVSSVPVRGVRARWGEPRHRLAALR